LGLVLAIDASTSANIHYEDKKHIIHDCIDDTPISDFDSIEFLIALYPNTTRWARINGESIYFVLESIDNISG